MKKSYLEDVAKDIRNKAKGNKLSKDEASSMMQRIRASKKLIDVETKMPTGTIEEDNEQTLKQSTPQKR